MIEDHVPALSTYARDIDQLIYLIAWIVMAWFFLALFVFLGFVWKFRAKEGVPALDMDGTNKKHKRFITWPHNAILIFDLIILVFAVKVWYTVKQDVPETQETVRIVGQQWAWSFVHPGKDGDITTEADNIRTVDELHIKKGVKYKYELQATDVLHSFSVPVFRLKQDAIPGRVITGWFEATAAGVYDIQCAEMCGIGHGVMAARIFIESPEDHEKWLASMTPNPPIQLAPLVPTHAASSP